MNYHGLEALKILVLASTLAGSQCTVVSVNCTSNVCPHESVTYTCTVSGAIHIKWGYQDGDDFYGVVLTSSSKTLSDYGLTITLIDKTSTTLTATVDFQMTATLNNTYMLCDDQLLGDPSLTDGCYLALHSFDPAKVHQLSFVKTSADSIRLDWSPYGNNTECIAKYEVRVNNGSITETTKDTFIVISGLDATEEHMVEVATVDQGNKKGEPASIAVYIGESTANSASSGVSTVTHQSYVITVASTSTQTLPKSSTTATTTNIQSTSKIIGPSFTNASPSSTQSSGAAAAAAARSSLPDSVLFALSLAIMQSVIAAKLGM